VGKGGKCETDKRLANGEFNRYDYDIASAILIIIIALVMAIELASGVIRKRLQ
jgi:phosphonate transport system permease protein